MTNENGLKQKSNGRLGLKKKKWKEKRKKSSKDHRPVVLQFYPL